MKTARVRLTRRLIDDLQPAAADRFLWDSEVVGFGLKLTPSGGRSFVLQYRQEGRSRRFAIGRFGSPWSVETARERARVLLGEIAQGDDPQGARCEARREITVAELVELYLSEGMVTRKPTSRAGLVAPGARRGARVSGARLRLTKGIVEGCAPGVRDRFLWDAEVGGFGVKVTPAGGRSYVLQYRAEGRARRFTIGRHGAPWTVETARLRARGLLRLIAEGRDPQAERLAARADLTVAALCDLYVREGLAGRRPHAVAGARRNLDNHVKPRIGEVMVSKVTTGHVEGVFRAAAAGRALGPGGRPLAGGRQAANAVLAAMSAAFGFAVRRGLCRDNPATGLRRSGGGGSCGS